MKLAKYLADYINYDLEENDYHADGGYFTDADLIRGGIEVFESTEGVEVLVVNEKIAETIKQAIQDAENSK